MSNEPQVVDWANISDDEDEDIEDSPKNDNYNEQIAHEGEPANYEYTQGRDSGLALGDKKISDQKVPMTEEEIKASMISHITTTTNNYIYINIHGLNPSIIEDDIREFYSPIRIDRVIPNKNRDMLDLEFTDKEEALKVVEKGAGVVKNCKFAIRMSLRKQPGQRQQGERKDRNNRNYGQKGQSRNYNKDKGGNYNRQGSFKGDYNQRNSNNQRGSYNQEQRGSYGQEQRGSYGQEQRSSYNQEHRGSYNQSGREDRNYEQRGSYNPEKREDRNQEYRGQDNWAPKKRNDDRYQQGGYKKDYNQQQHQQHHQQQNNAPKEPQLQLDEKRVSEEAPKKFGFFNKNKEEQKEKEKQDELKKQEEERIERERQEELRKEKEREEERQRLQKEEEERVQKLKEEEELKKKNDQAAEDKQNLSQSNVSKRGEKEYPRKDDSQRRYDGGNKNYDNRKNKNNQYGSRNQDYYYQEGEDRKHETPKHGQEGYSGQNKGLQITKRQSSYKSQGSGKFYPKENYSERSDTYTPKNFSNFEEDWGYNDNSAYAKKYEPQGNKRNGNGNDYNETKVTRTISQPTYNKETVIYMKKQDSQPAPKADPGLTMSKNVSEPVITDVKKGGNEPPKKKAPTPSSKNKVNPYDLLRGNV